MREVFPQTGFVEQDVLDVLASDAFVYADCFTIQPLTGDPMRYTGYQDDVAVTPITGGMAVSFLSKELNISGLRMKCSTGLEVDEQSIKLDYSGVPLFQNFVPWPEALLQGKLDGSVIRRDRFFAQDHNTPWVGGCTMFRGRCSTISSVGASSATIKVKSHLILLDAQMPRDLFEPNCKNTWGDVNCGVNQQDYAVFGTVGPGATRAFLPWDASSSDYSLGKVHIANGDSTTRVRTISRADDTGLYLAYPLDFDVADGLTFTAYPGCFRTGEACETYHGDNWQKRFKGFPFIPVPETAVGGL